MHLNNLAAPTYQRGILRFRTHQHDKLSFSLFISHSLFEFVSTSNALVINMPSLAGGEPERKGFEEQM